MPERMNERARSGGTLWAALLYLAACVYATWPIATDLGGKLLFSAEKFDGLGTIWYGEHMCRALSGGASPLLAMEVNVPSGLDLRLADSFLFGLLYFPFCKLFTPVVSFNVFCLVAITLTGAAGFLFARRALDASWLGAFAAGAIVAFNSLNHSFRIEGEAYLLAGFFLPLLAMELTLLVRTGERRHGLWAGLFLGALAWSSGYFGINGLLLTGSLGLALLAFDPEPREAARRVLPGLLVFGAVAGVLLAALAGLVISGNLGGALTSRFPVGQDPLTNVAQDAVSLSGLLIPFPSVTHLRGFRIFYMGTVYLSVALAALTIGRRRSLGPWLVLAGAGLIMAMGPYLRIGDSDFSGPELPYAWMFAITDRVLAYRMPYRFMALVYVALAALVAIFLTRLRESRLGQPWILALVGLVLVDGLFFTGFAIDDTRAQATVPAGYASLSKRGAVLDLWAFDRKLLHFSGRSAYYQVFHQQPVLCNFTRGGDRQSVINQRLALALMSGDADGVNEVLKVLRGLGVTDIALHSASFEDETAASLRVMLATVTEEKPALPDESWDPVEVYAIPEGDRFPEQEALDLLESWEDAS